MLDIHTFASLNTNPSITDISLSMLQDYYDHYLLHNTYQYYLSDGRNISIKFEEKHLCHLLGIKKLVQGTIHRSQLYSYFGIHGYQGIKNGTIDFASLKKIGKKRFSMCKDKWVFFFLLHRMMEAPYNKTFIKYVPTSGTQVFVEFLVYDICDNAIGHLGIGYDKDDDLWFPQSFMTERINATSNGMRFIDGRPTIGVEKIIKKTS